MENRRRLAKPFEVERSYTPDREAMLAALRLALGLKRPFTQTDEGVT